MADSQQQTPAKPQLRSMDADGERRASWAELLNDLVFTVIIMQLAQRLLTSLTGESLAEFFLLYVPIWWLWNGETHYSTRFDNERDVVHRVLSSLQLLGLIILVASIPRALESNLSSVVYALSYSFTRLILLIEYGRAWFYIPKARPYIQHLTTGFAASILLWVASTFVEAPYRYILWGVAVLIELGTPLTTSGNRLYKDLPPDVRHLPERYGLFTLLVLGQTVSSAAQGLIESGLDLKTIVATLLGGIIIIGLWWAYFDRLDDDAVRQVREGGDTRLYTAWLYLHLPLTVALTTTGVGLTLAIKHINATELPPSTHWLFIGSVSAYLLTEGCISLTTLKAGPPHPSFTRGIYTRLGIGIFLLVVGVLTSLSAMQLLLLSAVSITGLIVSDQLGPEAPESAERIGGTT